MKKQSALTIAEQLQFSHAVSTLDEARIQHFFELQNLDIAKYRGTREWWAAVHTIRLQLVTSTPEQLQASETYLRFHGFPVPKNLKNHINPRELH